MPSAEAHRSRITEEELWRARLHEAKLRYDAAASASRDTMQSFRQRSFPTPDGGAALKNALSKERVARSEYMRVLRILTDLCVNGKSPDR
ncbi:MAG TPA: hypothetical protein VGH38_36390 [Bryobacteraceae bacterium]